MSEHKNNSKGGVGVIGLLGVTFIVLKLVGVIGWRWIWVLSPFWISAIVAMLVIVVYAILVNYLDG